MTGRDQALTAIGRYLQTGHCQPPVGNWQPIIALADEQWITPALWSGTDHRNLPEPVADYVRQLHRLNASRNHHLHRQLLEAIGSLNQAGIEPVLLKGAIHLIDKYYPDPAARVMTDLDLLIEPGQIGTAIAALAALGYRAIPDPDNEFSGHHHTRPLFRAGDYGAIELHTEPLSLPAANILSADRVRSSCRCLTVEGVRLQIPSVTVQVLQLLLHSQWSDRHHALGAINLRALYELSVIRRHHDPAIDWPWIAERMVGHRQRPMLSAWLYSARQLFGCPLPPGIEPGWRDRWHYRRCRWQLQFGLTEPMARLYWVVNRFSAMSIRRHYPDSRLPLIVNRLRYLFFYGRHRLTALIDHCRSLP